MPFENNEWEWGWCVETLEHVPQDIQVLAVEETLRVCQNVVFCYPTPTHPTFAADPGHVEVLVNFKNIPDSKWIVTDKSSKTGRNVYIIREKGYKDPIKNFKPLSEIKDWM
jgi:hypothetical protein